MSIYSVGTPYREHPEERDCKSCLRAIEKESNE